MKTSAKKRFLAYVLAFLMVFTYVPATAYATDSSNAGTDAEAAAVTEETVAEEAVQATEDAAQDSEEAQTAETEEEITVEASEVTETYDTDGTETEVTVLDGQVSITNSAGTGSVADGVVTMTAAGGSAAAGGPKTNTVTIYNETSKTATLSFDYAVTNYKAYTGIDSDNGTYTETLDADACVTITFTGKQANTDNTAVLTLSNFSLTAVADAADITFSYDEKLGSITVAGETAASGTTKTTTYADGLALTATPAAEAEFLGWINAETGKIFSTDAEYTLKPTESAAVEAVFINEESGSYYLAGGKFILTDLDEATAKAATMTKKVVALMNDVTLEKGTYTIPEGVTLLVPFDADYTLYTTTPEGTHTAYATPEAYRTLTLAEGAELVVNGAVSLSAKHYAASSSQRGSGAPTGDVSFMELEKGSAVTVNDGGAFYAYGFVTGEGTVTAASGATVYENFQIEDFRGGTITSNMAVSDIAKGVLPLSQYYVQNIEAAMTLEAGATEYCYTSLYMSDMIFGSSVKFIGETDAMFNLESGYVTKSYDGATDRLIVEGNGDMSLSPITVALDKQKIDSKSFELPINSNITVKINSGDVEINQDVALLPGAEIQIAEGATCTLGSGVNVYVYDADQWGAYVGPSNVKMYPVVYAPGKEYTRTEKDLVDAAILVNGKLDAADGYLYTTASDDYATGHANIYSTGNGVIDIVSGEQECTYQFTQSGSEGTYTEIYLLPANLKNEDGTYVQTLDVTTGRYKYANGTWGCDHEVASETVTKEATCTEDGLKTVTCACEVAHTYIATVPAAHDLTAIDRKEPTCTEDGYTAGGQCSKCDYVEETQTLPATGHTEEAVKDVKATCTETGLKGKTVCATCGEVLNEGTVIEALGHDWDNGYVSKEATYEEEGEMTYTCNTCRTTKTEVIEKKTERTVEDFDTFIELFPILEDLAYEYTFTDKGIGKDPAMLVIKYMRTGVDRYNSGSWQIMAGYEDTGFASFVENWEEKTNAAAESEEDKIYVTALKNLENFYLPNGDYVDLGHMFGTMDISYTNIDSIDHWDVSGWAGDTTDLLSTADYYGDSGELEDLVEKIYNDYLCKSLNKDDIFSSTDMLGDMDGYYFINELKGKEYEKGMLSGLMKDYFTEELTEAERAEYFMENRLQCGETRSAVRNAVYNAYTGNHVIATLEGTREFQSDEDTLNTLRRACCYAVADYFCKLAGDYVNTVENPFYSVYNETYSNLAPGISQEVKMAKTVDGKEMVYYVATADITRDDVNVYANYSSRPVDTNEDGSYSWAMARVLDQANNVQAKYGDPESPDYIENYNVITAINADGFNMTTGEPGGLLIMDGKEYHGIDNGGFFGITKDGEAVLGTIAEYNAYYKDKLAEGVGGFGTKLVTEGKIANTPSSDYYTNRASRTAVGITKTGKVVFLVVDGRQQSSVGGSMEEIAQIMLEAGCYEAINLDGGGSTTYVGRPEGSDELAVINEPSDGMQRSVGTSIYMVSTAPSSTAFDHAIVDSPTNYMTKNASMQMTAKGASATGNSTDLPEDVEWAVDSKYASITEDGVLTATRTGKVSVQLKQGEKVVGHKDITVVVPDKVTFTKSSVNVVYGSSVDIPVKAYYEGKLVTVAAGDFVCSVDNTVAGTFDGLKFTATPGTGIRNTSATLTVVGTEVSGTITIRIYNQGETTFDFDQATGGSREFAWDRQVSNSTVADNSTYYVIEKDKDMTTSYSFAIDMAEIPIPKELEDLTYMLPGSDLEGACAWTFLCNLAVRISDLTEVTAVVNFDKNVDVDYSNVKVVNDYFKLTSTEFDDETNTLTLKLNWIRQKEAIDVDMANPICIVNGLKCTPKDGAEWDANDSLQITNSGSISYKAYMKASSLVTFAKDPANQARYKLYPYENDYIMDNGDKDAGAWFGSTYCNYSDTYSLVNKIKNGWIAEGGGQAYYINGVKQTGVQLINGEYYDFGETGVIASKDTKYTGLVENADHTYSYSKDGLLQGGWVNSGNDYYYFAYDTKKALGAGKHEITVTAQNSVLENGEYQQITETVEFEFDKTGKLLHGTWFTNSKGQLYYYYGPGFYSRKWVNIDGKDYYFIYSGRAATGIMTITITNGAVTDYLFADDGALICRCEGFVEWNGRTYYYVDTPATAAGDIGNKRLTGLQQIDGKYYKFNDTAATTSVYYGNMQTGKQDISAYNTDGCQTLKFDKSVGGYAVDINGKAVTSLAHNYVNTYIAPTTTTKGGWCMQCTNCGDISKWTKVQTFKQYINSAAIKGKSVASIKTETITLTWTKSIDAKMTRYEVYRSKTGKAGSYKKIATTKIAKYVDKTAKPGTKYYYKVKGVRVVGKNAYKTKWSNVMSNKIKKVTAKYVKASKMTAKTAYLGKGVKVTWTAPRVKAGGYEVWRATSKNGKYTKVKTTKNLYYNNTGLKVGKTYWYKVRAYKMVNGKKVYTKFSAKVSKKVLSKANAKIANSVAGVAGITNVKAATVTNGIKVTWNKKTACKANQYEVYRSTAKNGKYTKIATVKTKYYTDKSSKLVKGKTYYYKIVGKRTVGGVTVKTLASAKVKATR